MPVKFATRSALEYAPAVRFPSRPRSDMNRPSMPVFFARATAASGSSPSLRAARYAR